MRLWNALSGTIYHWNSTRVEIHKEIYPRLRMMPPDKKPLRDIIFAGHAAFFRVFGDVVFSEHPDISSRNLAGKLSKMNTNTFMNLMSSFLCDTVIRVFGDADSDETRNFGAILLLEACTIYGRDRLFAATRLQMYEDNSVELSRVTMINDTSLILDLNASSEWEVYPWLVVREQMQVMTIDYVQNENWSALVDKELSRPPRIGGYADQLT
jgi:hypothetical protein